MNSDIILSGRISADLKWKPKELSSSLGAVCSRGWMLSGPAWAMLLSPRDLSLNKAEREEI